MLTWLDVMGRRNAPPRHTRAEFRDYAKLLASIRNELPDDDARLRNTQLQGAWFKAQLDEQAKEYREKLHECYVVIACLVVVIVLLVIP